MLDLDELFTRIAQLAKRVIDYRTFGILLVNDDNELEMKLAVKYGEKVEVPRVRARRRAGRLRRAAPRSGARSRRVAGSALHQPRAGRALGAGHPAAAEGSLHRRRRSREPRARRVHQARRRDPDAAREPGGGGDRERAALRRSARDAGAAREGSALRAARPGGAAARGAAEAAEGRGAGRRVCVGARARAATFTTTWRRNRTSSSSPSATSRARASRRRSTARSRRSSCAAARSAGATCPSDRVPPACCRR